MARSSSSAIMGRGSINPSDQRTLEKTERIELLPAREFPTDREAIKRFRERDREQIEGDPLISLIYKSGTGLGLAIARGLLTAEDGRIWCENVPDGGARFTIAVPCAVRRLRTAS